jgi:hypothetical protein
MDAPRPPRQWHSRFLAQYTSLSFKNWSIIGFRWQSTLLLLALPSVFIFFMFELYQSA